MLWLNVHGGFSLKGADGTEIGLKSKKARAMLAYLALSPGRSRSREAIMALLWSDRGESQARASLRQVLSGLRKQLGDRYQAALKITDEAVSLEPELVVVVDGNPGDELLAGFRLDDPAFEEWLRDERLRLEDTSPPEKPTQPSASQVKPSIAVLPFTNMSGDADQEYFSDGITEDIITNLSRFRDFLVIARISTFAYKGKPVDVKEVGQKLGVGYVLEGSVQQSANRVRITAQLIDSETGAHLWSERYDRQLDDVFDVQDEVTELIVGTLASGYGGRLRKAWQRRERKDTQHSAKAFDYFMRGMDMFDKWTRDDVRLAREFFNKAIELDPNHARALAKLAWSHLIDGAYSWSEDYDYSIARGLEFATKSIEVEDEEAWGHWALSGYYLLTGNHGLAVSEILRASELNPNDADVLTDLALILNYAGRTDEAIEYAHQAMRLNPHHPEWYLMQLVPIYFDAHRYEDAIMTFRRLRSIETTLANLYLAAAHAALGQGKDAARVVNRVLELDPDATVAKWSSARLAPYQEDDYRQHFRNCLSKAGLPA